MGSGAARSPQFRVAGKRGLSGLRIVVRSGDGLRRSIRCTIHLVPGLWRPSGGLVGGPALAAENELGRVPIKSRSPDRARGMNFWSRRESGPDELIHPSAK